MTDLESESKSQQWPAISVCLVVLWQRRLLSLREGRSDCESHIGVRRSQPLVGWPMSQPPREWGLRLAKLKLETERPSTRGWVRNNLER